MTSGELPVESGAGRVAAIVVTYNSSRDIEDCLKSLVASGVDQILVLDNASLPEEAQEISDTARSFPSVVFTQSSENLGFGAGVNNAVRTLQPSLDAFDYIWIVNPDTIADSRALSILRTTLEDEKYDVVSPRLTTSGGAGTHTIWFDGGRLDLNSVRTEHLRIGENVGDARPSEICTFLTGCALFMRTTTWKKLGGFSSEYFLYWEDADLSWRAAKAGLTLGIVSEARLWHSVGGSGDRSGKSSIYYYYMQRNRVLFARKLGIPHRLLIGRGFLESIKLTLRPLKQRHKPVSKFMAGISGITAGATMPVYVPQRDDER